jgi:hypothetical protein
LKQYTVSKKGNTMPSSSNNQTQYSESQKVELALIAVFPTVEAYRSFIEDDKEDAGPFIRLARQYGIIGEKQGARAIEAFIEDNSRSPDECMPPEGLKTLSDLLEGKEVGMTVRSLTKWINKLINEFDLGHIMPAGKVSNAMFSRLGRGPANTRTKRNTLRLLAFWFGYKRPHLGAVWNYDTLRKLCPSEQRIESDEGARIGFYLHSRGDLIEDKTVKWLKNELRSCIEDLGHVQYGKIQSYSTTSFYLDLANEGIAKEGLSHSSSYGRCVRDAIAIAHQVAIRWALSPLRSQRKIMTIGIAAGKFSTLDVYVQTVLNVKLPGDPVIRVTDYTRQCVLVNDIRATFCQLPKEIEVFDGEIVNIWWIKELWNIYYWDFVPALLKDEMLQNDPQSEERLRTLLWFPDEKLTLTEDEKKPNAITTFLKFPQNSLLGLEIAKTLYYRRKFLEANEILRMILSTEPHNLTARTLRMAIFCNLGLDESLPYSAAKIYFKRAENEAAFIEENCTNKDEDYYCERAYCRLAQALRILHLIRLNRGEYHERDISLTEKDVYRLLSDAEDLFMRGVTVSSTGHRSMFMIGCVCSLRRMLKKNEDFVNTPEGKLLDKHDICKETAEDIFSVGGWLRKDYTGDIRYGFLRKRMKSGFMLYDNAVLLRTRQPNMKFSYALGLWDFSPVITVGIAKSVIKLLKEAIAKAKQLKQDKVCVVSITRVKAEIITVDRFIRDVSECIEQVESRVGSLEDLEKGEDSDPIEAEKSGGLKLFCLNI